MRAAWRQTAARSSRVHRAVIGLQADEGHARQVARLLRQRQHGGVVGHAAAALAHVHFHQHVDLGAGRGHGLRDPRQVGGIVDTDAELGGARQLGQEAQLGRADHFVADVDIGDAGGHERHGFADLLATDAARAQRQLTARDLGAFVGLGVRPQRDLVAVGPGLHGAQVGLERGQVQHQAGRVDAGQGIAGLGGRGQRNAAYDFLGHLETPLSALRGKR